MPDSPNTGLSHEYSAWQPPGITYLYEKALAGEKVDLLAETAAVIWPPESVIIIHPGEAPPSDGTHEGFRYPNNVVFETHGEEYAYAEENPPELYRTRHYKHGQGRRYIWGDYDTEEQASEAVRLDCAGRVFLRQFFAEPFAAGAELQNAWRIKQALDPANLKAVEGILQPHNMYIDGNSYTHNDYALGIRLAAMRNLVMRVNQHVSENPDEADSMLNALSGAAHMLADNEATFGDAKSLHGALVNVNGPSSRDPGPIDAVTAERFRIIGEDILITAGQRQEQLLSIVSQTPFDVRHLHLYEATEKALMTDPPRSVKKMIIASTDILNNMLGGIHTSGAQALASLIKRANEISGTASLRTYAQLANRLSPNLRLDLGRDLPDLDETTIRDLPEALDRIARVVINTLPDDPDAPDSEQVKALESMAHCARLAAELGVERKMGQRVLTIADLMIRYPDASERGLKYIAESLQQGKSQSEAHALYRELSARNRSHALFLSHRRGYGLMS